MIRQWRPRHEPPPDGRGRLIASERSEHESACSSAPARSKTERPGDNERQSQGGQMNAPGAGTMGTNRK